MVRRISLLLRFACLCLASLTVVILYLMDSMASPQIHQLQHQSTYNEDRWSSVELQRTGPTFNYTSDIHTKFISIRHHTTDFVPINKSMPTHAEDETREHSQTNSTLTALFSEQHGEGQHGKEDVLPFIFISPCDHESAE